MYLKVKKLNVNKKKFTINASKFSENMVHFKQGNNKSNIKRKLVGIYERSSKIFREQNWFV